MNLKKFHDKSKESNKELFETDKISQHITKVISFYDDAIEYIKTLPSFHIGYTYSTQKLIELALLHTTFDNKSVLEIGCGLGTSLDYLTRAFNIKYTGIDINRNQIEFLLKKIQKQNLSDTANAFVINALELNDSIGKFDIVWSEDSFSHIPNRLQLFNNIYSVLKGNGVFVFSDLVKNTNISDEELMKQQSAWCLWNLESTETYLNLLKNAGFVVLNYKENLGNILLNEHIKVDIENGDISYKVYLNQLHEERDKLINEWGIFNYLRRFERLRTYEYIEFGKLDYNFFIAIKR